MNFNPYNQYPYSYQQNQMQPMQSMQPMQQPVYNQQTTYLPLTFVNGIEGAKAFIVSPNQTVYLKDSDSNTLFEKKADNQGKYTLTAYEMKPIDFANIGKPSNDVMYMTFTDFKKYELQFEKTVEELRKEIKDLRGASNE